MYKVDVQYFGNIILVLGFCVQCFMYSVSCVIIDVLWLVYLDYGVRCILFVFGVWKNVFCIVFGVLSVTESSAGDERNIIRTFQK